MRALLVTLALSGCGPDAPAASESDLVDGDVPAPPYRVWQAGNAATDQSAQPLPQSSGLVGRGANDDVSDQELGAAFALAAGAQPAVRIVAAFSECFGGGMFDDAVAQLDGIGAANPLLLSSASRFDQVAYYPSPLQPIDWGWGWVGAMAGGVSNAGALSFAAARDDDFRKVGLEEPQHFARGGGDAVDLVQEAPLAIAVLWSGQPARVDGQQIAVAIAALRAFGLSRSQIFVFYGDGNLPAGHVIEQQQAAGDRFALARAGRMQLAALWQAAFAGGWATAPKTLFFFANDHGYNTAVAAGAAVPREGDYEEDYDANDDGDYGPSQPSFPSPFEPPTEEQP